MSAARHIPHEHFIMAFSALVIALSGVILTSHPAGAETNWEMKVNVRVYCTDSDQLDTTTKGTTALIKIDQRDPQLKTTIVEKNDACIGRRTVREYYCNRNGVGLASKIIACAKNLICNDGACVEPNSLSAPSSAPSETPPAGG